MDQKVLHASGGWVRMVIVAAAAILVVLVARAILQGAPDLTGHTNTRPLILLPAPRV